MSPVFRKEQRHLTANAAPSARNEHDLAVQHVRHRDLRIRFDSSVWVRQRLRPAAGAMVPESAGDSGALPDS